MTVKLGTPPQRQLLLNAVRQVAILVRLKSFIAVNTATEHRHWVFPGADRLCVQFGGMYTGISGFEGWIVRASLGDEPVNKIGGDGSGIGRLGWWRVVSSRCVQQPGAREQNGGKSFHDKSKM